MKALLRALFIVLICTSCSMATALTAKTRVVTGYGTVPTEAVANALVEAVSQLKGVLLTSEQVTRHFTSETSLQTQDEWNEEFRLNSSLSQFIKQSTQGKLDGYTVQDVVNTGNGFEATVAVQYHEYRTEKTSISEKRRRLAVVPFDTGRQQYLLLGDRTPDEKVERELRNRLIDLFTQSRRLSVMDREYGEAFEDEKRIWLSGDAAVGESARAGNVRGVDYLVVGNIKQLKSTRHVEKIQLTGEELSSYSGGAQVDYKIILAATRQVKWSNSLVYRFSDQDIRDMLHKYGSSQTGMLHRIAKDIVDEALGNIYPMRVVAVKGNTLILNQGGESLKKGQILDVYFAGEEVFDPYTGESLGSIEEYVGKAKVVRAAPKMTYTKLIEGDIDFVDVGSIVRPSK